jgi:diguanylate cyclase (GGDEF)-like protein
MKQRLLASLVGLGILLSATAGLLAYQLYDHAMTEAKRTLQTLALVLSEQASRSFDAVQLVQDGIIDQLERAGVETPDQFREQMSGRAVHDELKERIKGLPELAAITAIDTAGTLINFTRYWPIPTVNVADRDYFKALSSTAQKTSFISMPVLNRGTGTWTIYLARRVSSRDGQFLGLILAGVELEYFDEFFRAVAPSPTHVISLFRDDGILLARFPHSPSAIGQSSAGHTLFQELRATTAPSLMVRQNVSTADGKERFIALHRLSKYPMVATISARVGAGLAEWRNQVIYLAATTLVLEAMLMFAGRLMLQQLRTQTALKELFAEKAQAENIARETAEANLALVQDRARVERERYAQNVRFGVAMNNMSLGLLMVDADERLVLANGALTNILGLPPSAVCPGATIDEFLATTYDSSIKPTVEIKIIASAILTLRLAGEDGSRVCDLPDGRAIMIVFRPIEEDGWLATLDDITERRQADARIIYMAHHDVLTGLPNRVRFQDGLKQASLRSRRGARFAVMCLDLDGFKSVNDTRGHPVGDQLLQAVAERLRNQVRETDIIARLGGDEFAIIHADINQAADATVLTTRIIDSFAEPFQINEHILTVGVSIGVAVIPEDGHDPDIIMRKADVALYRAKAEGRGRDCFFDPTMDPTTQTDKRFDQNLQAALPS